MGFLKELLTNWDLFPRCFAYPIRGWKPPESNRIRPPLLTLHTVEEGEERKLQGDELEILQDVGNGGNRTSAEETSREVDHASTLWRSCACSLEVGT